MTDRVLKEIREKISCPQLGDNHYGEWGILTKNQRFTIKRLLDLIESQEGYIRHLHSENERLKKTLGCIYTPKIEISIDKLDSLLKILGGGSE